MSWIELHLINEIVVFANLASSRWSQWMVVRAAISRTSDIGNGTYHSLSSEISEEVKEYV